MSSAAEDDAKMEDSNNNAMGVDALDPGKALEDALRAELKSSGNYSGVEEWWNLLKISHSRDVSGELSFLKQLSAQGPATDCGITFYSLEQYPSPRVLELDIKEEGSNLYFERGFYSNLYDEIIRLWKDEGGTRKKKMQKIKGRTRKKKMQKIVLTGNAGVGKSWFQIYVLRRLLKSTDRLFRFVLRQIGTAFYLYDLDTCAAFRVKGDRYDVKKAISAHGRILYLYEPDEMVDQPPLAVEAPSLSTLSPRKNRIKEYMKLLPHVLYMPVGDYEELECIAGEEGLDIDVVEKNYHVFGGIFRYSLFHTDEERETKKRTVNAKCEQVTAGLLRSIGADIDDDPQKPEGNISGFVLSYTDIPLDGQNPFTSPSLTLTSSYIRERITNKLSLSSYQEHVVMLAETLQKMKLDHSGMDLEKSVVFMLSLGPHRLKWQYRAVGGEPDRSIKDLALTKREITRGEFNAALVNYPSDMSYPLVDCVFVINNVYWTVQTTWQRDYAFKLRTLLSLRTRLNLNLDVVLNILFVNPAHHTTYENRHRSDYLAKGELVSKDILDSKKRLLMPAHDVAIMWKNTRVFVAFPKDNDWQNAIKTALNVAQVVNKD